MKARRLFDTELGRLNSDLLEMTAAARDAFLQMREGVAKRDTALLQAIVAGDKQVDEMEKAIESRCLYLLMKQQPVVATDLRAVSTALKLTTDIERIGDQAADIAEIAVNYCGEGRDPMAVPSCLEEMFSVVEGMLRDSITAFADSDLLLSKEVEERDDLVDECFARLKVQLVSYIKEEKQHPDDLLDILMIGKYLERIADHCTNVCEWVEFFQTGRHQQTQIL